MEIMNWKKNINTALDSNKIVYYFGDSIYCENKDNQVAFEISLKTPFILKFQIGVLEWTNLILIN